MYFLEQYQIKDNWIDDIDWAKVKQTEKSQNSQAGLKEPLDVPETVDIAAMYESMLRLMQPGETVARAIKRLGGGRDSGGKSAAAVQRRQAWKNKKAQQQMEASSTTGETLAGDKAGTEKTDLLELIGCADKLLTLNGEMGIYQDTFEKLSFKVKSTLDSAAASRPVDDGLDMFADDDSAKHAPAISGQKPAIGAAEKGNYCELICIIFWWLADSWLLLHGPSVYLPHICNH